MNWDAHISDLHVLALEQWCSRIKESLGTLHFYNIRHIYREHNYVVDCLSKESLNLLEGAPHFVEFVDNLNTSEGTLNVFQH